LFPGQPTLVPLQQTQGKWELNINLVSCQTPNLKNEIFLNIPALFIERPFIDKIPGYLPVNMSGFIKVKIACKRQFLARQAKKQGKYSLSLDLNQEGI